MFEKIRELLNRFLDNKPLRDDDLSIGYSHAIGDVFRVIRQEEQKPFTPEILGFKKLEKSDAAGSKSYQLNDYLLTDFDDHWKLSDNDKLSIDNLKINFHGEGEVVLRSLGVIDYF